MSAFPFRLCRLTALAVLVASLSACGDYEARVADGIRIDATPLQTPADGVAPVVVNGYTLTPLARFDISARVLSRREYKQDREAELSQLDLALGWGAMSDSAVLRKLEITQSDRFFFWRASALPIPRDEVVRSASNMHLIPADPTVRRTLLSAGKGDGVHLTGYLVEARGQKNYVWRSSLSREDSGRGACELVYVTAAEVLPLPELARRLPH
ncbi:MULTISPECIES: hypothetical protein [Gulbenkiania]|uniref:Lipoprotein n=2 Tax=Gulbenkiania TaxID=397456 RepID=A0A0K6GX95_9NEIS|nr:MULTISPECIES: hypothetical protein [Gulbenkiania]TCW33010.1 hypothetical protein EV669_102309 [Gulbenkiania mobilis]CUA83239.1 hypothetical protein Ga0061063_1644 [Gulbenkiania indica]